MRVFVLVLCTLLSACARLPEPPATPLERDTALIRQQERAKRVTIIRDDYGIPHIYGVSDADAVFGMLYAQAEDDFARVERNYIWAMGRLAEVEGEKALFSDLRARLFMTNIEARRAYDSAPPWLKALCIAFADGLNYYLHTHPEVKPALIQQFEPWMPMYFFEGSIGGDIEQVPLAGIEALYGEKSPVTHAALPPEDEPAGSNGFAISGEHTDSGHAMLLINPHTSFYFRPEVHVVSEEGLNAYGAVTWGQFFIYQGFNEHTGWMHTSTYADFMDEYTEETRSKEGALQYRYGDSWRAMWRADVTLQYSDGDVMKEKSFPLYRTHRGPVTGKLEGHWVSTRLNWDPVNALRQSFLRTKQSSHDEFDEIMQIRTNSSNNTVFADSSGNIAYYHGNFMPRRDARFDYSRPLDGTDPATDWQGLHTVEETITLLNPASGWIQNCNSTPFTAAGQYSPVRDQYPEYMAPDPENYRGVHAVRLLRDLAADPADKLSLNELIAMAYHPRLPAFEHLLPPLLQAWEDHRDPELKRAVYTLREWDYSVSLDSVAMSLAHFYAEAVMQGRDSRLYPGRMQWMQHYLATTADTAQLSVLKQVMADMSARYGRWDKPWGEINRYQRLDGAITSRFDDSQPSLPVPMASGRWGALAAYGSKRFGETDKLYGYRGNSFVAVVEFGDKVRAKTLLAGGQSGDESSVHFTDQAQRYTQRRFKDAAYYRGDVESRARSRYQPGQVTKNP